MQYPRFPGLLLSALLAAFSLYLADWPLMQQWGLSALSIAMLLGMILGNTGYHRVAGTCHDGVTFSKQALLRAGIILFGFRLTFHDIAAVGWSGLLIDILVLSSTFMLAYWVGHKWLGMDEHTAILIGAGSSICGAAAVLATEPVVKARADKVTVAVATVVVFGTLAMFVWPLIYHVVNVFWGVSAFRYGVFAGSTIHEVAQVAVAGRSVSELSMNTAVITKMLRVMLLAPFLMLLSLRQKRVHVQHAHRDHAAAGVTIPWFAVAFLAVTLMNSWLHLPALWTQRLAMVDNAVLAAAMAALGLTSPWQAIQRSGVRPLILASILFAWLIVGGGLINVVIDHLAS